MHERVKKKIGYRNKEIEKQRTWDSKFATEVLGSTFLERQQRAKERILKRHEESENRNTKKLTQKMEVPRLSPPKTRNIDNLLTLVS